MDARAAAANSESKSGSSSWKELSRYQWLVLGIAWLGWVFDSMDATIYALVMSPALRELLGPRASTANVGWYGGVIFAIFVVGWALGGIVFGAVADRLGRVRTLVITILIYAVFTGAAGLAHTWWQLALYRFLTALGIGGEWAPGATLVAEAWPESLRVKGAGLLQSAWGAGFLLGAAINFALARYSWRLMFFVGLVPAVVAVVAQLKVKEPERWARIRSGVKEVWQKPRIAELFKPGIRRDTLVGAGLAFVAVFGLWGATYWTPSLVRELLQPRQLDEASLVRLVSYSVMGLNLGAIAGYLLFASLTDWVGRRSAFLIAMLGAAVTLPGTFLFSSSYLRVMLLLPVLGFFTNGIFSGFPVYLPELFPTRIRAMGSGFCFNAGRIFAAAGPFLTGYMVLRLGSFARAAGSIAAIYLLGMFVLLFARETKGEYLK